MVFKRIKVRQYEVGLSFPLVCANAERVPFDNASFDVAISELLHPDTFREERWDGPSFREGQVQTPGLDRAVHFYELPGETMWGATARILTRFLVHLVAQRLR